MVIFNVFERTGKCLVNVDPKASMALVTTMPGTPANDRAFTKVQRHIQDCLSIGVEKTDYYGLIEVQWNGTALTGAIAHALYRVQFASRPPSSLAVPATVAPIIPPGGAEKDKQMLANYAFAQCLADRHPDAVRSLVLSKAGSSEESAAFAQVQQFMGPCVYGPVRADRNSLRLILAGSLSVVDHGSRDAGCGAITPSLAARSRNSGELLTLAS